MPESVVSAQKAAGFPSFHDLPAETMPRFRQTAQPQSVRAL